MRGTYLYAITTARDCRGLGQLERPEVGGQVAILPENGLAAVVSEYRGPAFGDLPRAELLRCLANHQRVIERAVGEGPVLPVKFGTVLPSPKAVRFVLAHFQSRLTATLAELASAAEIDVAATWHLARTFAEIAHEPAIAALAATLAGQPAAESERRRLAVGKLVKEALDRRREAYREQVVRDLHPIARQVQPNALPAEELVLNVAFLVERARLGEFYARVTRLDEAFGNRLTFRCVGPLPPYSFATVELRRACPGEVEAARQLLELGETASEAELHACYRRLATRCHPDHHPGDPTARERFGALTAAHAQLSAYMRGQRKDEQGTADERPYDLTPAAVEGALLLAIRQPCAQASPPRRDTGRVPDAAIA